MRALKVIAVLSLLLTVLFTTLYIVGTKEQASPIDSVETATTLNSVDGGQQIKDNQSYVTYSHSDNNGHWFIDSSFSNDATLYVDDETMQGLEETDKYIATYVDASKWELESLENVK